MQSISSAQVTPDAGGRGERLSILSLPRGWSFAHSDSWLWFLVVGMMSLDVVSTVIGLSIGLVELNPIAAIGLEVGGIAALAALKVPVLVIGIIGWRTLPGRYRRLNLLGLTLPCTGAVASNSWLILTYV